MTDPLEKRHAVHAVGFVPEPDPFPHPVENPLTDLEKLALAPGLLATPEAASALWRQLDAWASQLADPRSRGEARVRHVARMIAVLRAKLLLNERRRDESLVAGELHQALVLDRLVQTDSRRLEALLREHREEGRGGARTVQIAAVAVGDRPQVCVVAGRGG